MRTTRDGPRGEFNEQSFRSSLREHLNRYDRAVVDYNELNAAPNVACVWRIVAALPAHERARAIEIERGAGSR